MQPDEMQDRYEREHALLVVAVEALRQIDIEWWKGTTAGDAAREALAKIEASGWLP